MYKANGWVEMYALQASRRQLKEQLRDDPEWYLSFLGDIMAGSPLMDAAMRRSLLHEVVLEWMYDPEYPERLEAYYRAMRIAAEAHAHQALQIADTTELGIETKTKADGSKETTEGDMLGHRKLRVETRLKLMEKWAPERFGDARTGGTRGVTVVIQQFAGTPIDVPAGYKLDVGSGRVIDPDPTSS